MSSNPIYHPLLVSVGIDLLFVTVIDKFRGQLDLHIGGSTWYRYITFPIWAIVVVFCVLSFLRKMYDSYWYRLATSYLHKEPSIPMRKPSVRVNSSPRVWSSSVDERDITSATTPSSATRRYYAV